MEGYTNIEIVLGVIEGEVERHVGVVDVYVDELDDVLVRNLPQNASTKKRCDKRKFNQEKNISSIRKKHI